jgi:hypothetical protein
MGEEGTSNTKDTNEGGDDDEDSETKLWEKHAEVVLSLKPGLLIYCFFNLSSLCAYSCV